MLTKRAATLQDTLGLKEVPANGTAWHQLLLQGLPHGALKSVARELGLTEPRLAAHLGLKPAQAAARKKARKLSAGESDVLYAIALAYVQLAGFKGTADAKAWLLSSASELKGVAPFDLLRTRLGTEYVTTAITRMRPAPVFIKTVEEERDDEDAELA